MRAAASRDVVTFAPNLRATDACANHWLRQVMLRLRREMCWCWHERGGQPGSASPVLPPFSDKLIHALDQSRFWADKQRFYATDAAARHLTEQIAAVAGRAAAARGPRGSFGWVVESIALDDVSAFTLALGLTVAFDASVGSVIAACLNDQTKRHPTLALAQKLWDAPEDVLRLADPLHPLFRLGLLQHSGHGSHFDAETRWDTPFSVPSLVAGLLLFPDSPLPHGLELLPPKKDAAGLSDAARVAALRLKALAGDALRIVPVIGTKGSARGEVVQAVAAANDKQVVEFQGATAPSDDHRYSDAIATVAWLKDLYLFFSGEAAPLPGERRGRIGIPSAAIPATVFVAVSDRSRACARPAWRAVACHRSTCGHLSRSASTPGSGTSGEKPPGSTPRSPNARDVSGWRQRP